jgi:hypothetical protein
LGALQEAEVKIDAEYNAALLRSAHRELAEARAEIAALRARERHLIDLCHRVDQGLQALQSSPEFEDLIKDLESVRLWWYPAEGKAP